MKLLPIIGFGLLVNPLGAQSFVDWTGVGIGADSDQGSWDGYGTVFFDIEYFSNSNGITPTGTVYPRPSPTGGMGDLDPFGIVSPTATNGIAFVSGSINGSSADTGYNLTFTFSDGVGGTASPNSEPVFYLTDVDYGDFTITAYLNGVTLDTSDWYYGVVQTSTVTPSAAGLPSVWNATTSTLEGRGPSSTWTHQFKPTTLFDTLQFTYKNGSPPMGSDSPSAMLRWFPSRPPFFSPDSSAPCSPPLGEGRRHADQHRTCWILPPLPSGIFPRSTDPWRMNRPGLVT